MTPQSERRGIDERRATLRHRDLTHRLHASTGYSVVVANCRGGGFVTPPKSFLRLLEIPLCFAAAWFVFAVELRL